MRTWRKHLPDYEIVEWNETNFDVNTVPFTKAAYEHSKWAFVSDYVRLYALYHHGGIYFDTDVEVLKSFDDLLDAPAFMGYESEHLLGTAVMAAEAGSTLIKDFLDHYNNISFSPDAIQPNIRILSEIVARRGVTLDNTLCKLDNDVVLYPIDYLIVLTFEEFKMHLTDNSHSIHHYEASWFPLVGRLRLKMLKGIGQKGRDLYHYLARIIKRK